MADTENSILEEGIPEITLQLQVNETVPAPVDDTLSIAGQAADAKATGDAISGLQDTLEGEMSTLQETLSGDITLLQTTLETAIAALFPVGSVYATLSTTAPAFYGTWVEITMPATWGDLEDGMRSYADGTGTGNLHFWRRTA